jgi:glycerol kinase
MTARHVLALDQGTSGSRAAIVDADGEVVGRAYAELHQHYPQPGWVEHDPVEIWETTLTVARQAMTSAQLHAGDLAAVGITNQRETVVVWDRANGEPVANAIVWQDRRTASRCDELRRQGAEELVRQRTGLLVDAYFSGTKLAWLLDHGDGLRARAERGELAFGTVDSWLLYRLTGGRVHATEVTNASRTMLFNIVSLRWDEDLLGLLGVPPQVLPEVRPSLHLFGETDPGLFGGPVPVAGMLGDQQASLFAQCCFEPGQAKNTYGTGSFVLANTGTEPVLGNTSTLTTIAVGIDGHPTEYALEGSIFVTGSAVQWLRDGLGLIADAAETEALARSVPDTGDVWFVPGLAGLGAPRWDPYARGLLIGMTRGTTRAHVARAVLESIAYATRDVVDAIESDSEVAIRELRVDGGAVTNQFLMQFQADVLGIPVDVPVHTESTSLGSALLAGLATGVWADQDEVATTRRSAHRYEPAMGASERDARFARWTRAVERALDWAAEGPEA